MLKIDSVHIYPSNMKWETRINKITKSLIYLKLQKRILVIGMNENNENKIYKFQKGIVVWLYKIKFLSNDNLVKKAFNFLSFYIGIFFKIRNLKIKYINAHSLMVLPLAMLIKLTNKDTKIIYDTHELETETSGRTKFKKIISKFIEKICIKFVDIIIVVSPSIETWYKVKYKKKFTLLKIYLKNLFKNISKRFNK